MIADTYPSIRNNKEIVKKINDRCYDIAIMNPADDKAFHSKLKELADSLRVYFDSDYCAIGKVDRGFVEDCIVSRVNINTDEEEYIIQERNLKSVRRVRLDNEKCCVSLGLKSTDSIKSFDEDEIKDTENYGVYVKVLGVIKNTTIIPIRDKDNIDKGFIQIINSRKRIKYDEISPCYDRMLGLILFIHLRDGLKDANSFKKDYDFISKVQGKIDNVDMLLNEIMVYLSKEFSAGIISYRIPLLVGLEKKPLFFLRDCFIHEDVAKYYSEKEYFKDRLVRRVDQMGGYEKLSCKNFDENNTIIIDKAKDYEYYNKFPKEIYFRKDTIIIPILRDYSEKEDCFYPQRNKEKCEKMDEINCPYRFTKYFGVFKLRVFKDSGTSESEEPSEWLSEDTKNRLSNLAKHISILLNAIVDKYENESLDVFQRKLKKTSFTKIKEFDEQSSVIVQNAIHTKNCTIFRYKDDKLTFSASSDSNNKDFNGIIDKYCCQRDELVKTLFARKEPIYYVSNENERFNSIMIVPMIRKDNSKLGVMLLVGKEDNLRRSNLSKTFWEHDKKHIEFIVDILTRIEESDSERLVFLSQLSHELLRPVTEMVYRNEYNYSTAMRNSDLYSKRRFINELKKNVDMCMTFKYIIHDVEFIYSLSKGEVEYNFDMVDLKGIIFDAKRLFEDDASDGKQLIIRTYLKNMPNKLYVDSSRMMQVVINLLKNAIQYSFVNEEIAIIYEFNKEKNCHEIDFRDKGIPVNEKEKDDIFNLFVRSKQAVEKRPNGSGMGLYLVKQIMKAHGGDCFVKAFSFPTIFTIQIPNK